ncbi:hypothetical protein Pcac1_g4473 [Phytophthora cactorum]|nr:hypothetical protein Pcac1_g4473 [Phytophthora cactorum]
MIVKYADGKPRRLTRRLATVAYAFGGFSGSDEFLVIELRASHRLVDPDSVEEELPRVVERELPDEVDAVKASIPYLEADPVSQRHDPTDMIERGLSSSTTGNAQRPVRRRSRRTPRRPRASSQD